MDRGSHATATGLSRVAHVEMYVRIHGTTKGRRGELLGVSLVEARMNGFCAPDHKKQFRYDLRPVHVSFGASISFPRRLFLHEETKLRATDQRWCPSHAHSTWTTHNTNVVSHRSDRLPLVSAARTLRQRLSHYLRSHLFPNDLSVLPLVLIFLLPSARQYRDYVAASSHK